MNKKLKKTKAQERPPKGTTPSTIRVMEDMRGKHARLETLCKRLFDNCNKKGGVQ